MERLTFTTANWTALTLTAQRCRIFNETASSNFDRSLWLGECDGLYPDCVPYRWHRHRACSFDGNGDGFRWRAHDSYWSILLRWRAERGHSLRRVGLHNHDLLKFQLSDGHADRN